MKRNKKDVPFLKPSFCYFCLISETSAVTQILCAVAISCFILR